MITMTVGQLLEAKDPMVRLMAVPLPLKQAYQLKRLAKTLDGYLETFSEARVARLKHYGAEKTLPSGETHYDIPPADLPVYKAEMLEMLKDTVDLDVRPFELTTLPESVTISANDIASLGPLVTYAEDSAEGKMTEGAAIP